MKYENYIKEEENDNGKRRSLCTGRCQCCKRRNCTYGNSFRDPEPVDGEAVIVVWIRWRYDEDTGEGGYTGISWYENDSNNGWIDKYYSLEEWKNYIVTARPTDLNDVLGDWDVGKKTDFLNAHKGELGAVDCIWFGNE